MNLSEFKIAVNESFVPLDVTTDVSDFHAEMREHRLVDQLGTSFVAVRADRHVVRRTEQLIEDSPRSFFKISLQLEGQSSMEQAGREVHLTAGDLVIYDTSKPYVLSFDSPFALMVIQIPHDKLRIPTGLVANAVATRIGASDGLGRVVSPFLMSIATNMEHLKGPAGAMLAKNALELLESLITNQLDVVKTARDPHWDLLRKIQDYVDDNLADPDLGPASVASAVHISTRHLHSLFARQSTTVSTYIRSRRLEKCYLDLTNRALADIPVSSIGAAWGFTDAAHFSRTFKAEYGQAPREARTRALRDV